MGMLLLEKGDFISARSVRNVALNVRSGFLADVAFQDCTAVASRLKVCPANVYDLSE
jgi:hypothetical protein